MGVPKPRLGLTALNPHGGEHGLFGDEEGRLLEPAVSIARQTGADLSGPYPADTLFFRALAGQFDGIVALYHDQGHIALKLAGRGRAVNISVGLPIIRTSVAHGTAFDIAWKGVADASGLITATDYATRLAIGRSQVRC
jgi:4-hydroxythreonine-4-phosphate dehydrogenase